MTPQAEAYIVDRIVAQVGDRIVTQYDIESYAPAKVRMIDNMQPPARDEAWDTYYATTLEDIIHAFTVEIAALRVGVSTTDSEIDNAILVLQEQNSIFREELQGIIAREGAVTPEVRYFVKTVLIQEKLMPMLRYRSVVTDEDIMKYLQEDTEIEQERTEYHIKLLFLPNADVYEDFKERIYKEGVDSVSGSDGASVIDMEYSPLSQFIPEIAEIIQGLKKGEISEPNIDDEGRFMLVSVIDIRESSGVPEEHRENLTNTLRNKQMEQIFTNWLERNRKSIIVHRYEL